MSSEHRTASGTFEVDLAPRPDAAGTDHLAPLAQMSLAKTWFGDVEGTGRGLMISGGDPAQGSAGYVAMEVVEGTVHGRSGSFALQQYGAMQAGEPHLVYGIVPGSGTGALAGISGVLALAIDDSGHHYEISYVLPDEGTREG